MARQLGRVLLVLVVAALALLASQRIGGSIDAGRDSGADGLPLDA